MNANELIQRLQAEVKANGYSTTVANVNTFQGTAVLFVRDTDRPNRPSKSKTDPMQVVVRVDDPEAGALKLSLTSENMIVHAEAHVSNLPLPVVARFVLDMVNSVS